MRDLCILIVLQPKLAKKNKGVVNMGKYVLSADLQNFCGPHIFLPSNQNDISHDAFSISILDSFNLKRRRRKKNGPEPGIEPGTSRINALG